MMFRRKPISRSEYEPGEQMYFRFAEDMSQPRIRQREGLIRNAVAGLMVATVPVVAIYDVHRESINDLFEKVMQYF